MQNPPKILIAAGGTGGHLIPAQQLGHLLQEKEGCKVAFAGYKLEKSPYFEKGEFPFFEISSASRSSDVWKLGKGVFQALNMLWKLKPDVIVGFGSYHSAPVLLAGAILRKKIVLYEANRQLGKVNRWLAFSAEAIGFQFPLMDKKSSKFISVRRFPWIQAEGVSYNREEALADYGLDPDRFTVLVFGGSQGAKFLNEIAPEVLKRLSNAQVIHLAGSEGEAEGLRKQYQGEKIVAAVKGFEPKMEKAYAAADFALCRSGASTIAELIRFQVPSLLIPYPYAAENHQQHNAQYLFDLGGAFFLGQKEANADSMVQQIKAADREKMKGALGLAARLDKTSVELHQLVSRICNKRA